MKKSRGMCLYDVLSRCTCAVELHIFNSEGDETILTNYEGIEMCRASLPIENIMAIDDTLVLYAEED